MNRLPPKNILFGLLLTGAILLLVKMAYSGFGFVYTNLVTHQNPQSLRLWDWLVALIPSASLVGMVAYFFFFFKKRGQPKAWVIIAVVLINLLIPIIRMELIFRSIAGSGFGSG